MYYTPHLAPNLVQSEFCLYYNSCFAKKSTKLATKFLHTKVPLDCSKGIDCFIWL